MERLSGLTGFEVALAFLCSVGVAFIITGGARIVRGFRPASHAVMPLIAGAILVIYAMVEYRARLSTLLTRVVTSPEALLVAAAISILGLALTDFLQTRGVLLTTAVARILRLPANRTVALALNLGLALLFGLVTLSRLALRDSGISVSSGQAKILDAFQVPGGYVMDLVFRTQGEGYISLAEGRIVHFHLPSSPGGRLELRTVAEGLAFPRGLAVVGDELFVGELGPLPCEPAYPVCKGLHVDPSRLTGERKIIESSRGQILAFTIQTDGSLGSRHVIVSDLPVVNTEHGVNDLTVGPDGSLYVSIGDIEHLWSSPDVIRDIRRPNLELLGTITRIPVDGSEAEVFARGLRNVYGLTFGDDVLYGVDNDGPTLRGWRGEELLRIRPNANYGYPQDATFSSSGVRTEPPIWLLQSIGSGGIGWRGRFGLSPGLLIGSCGKLESVVLTQIEGEDVVAQRDDVTTLAALAGCVTAIEPGPAGTVILGMFNYDDKLPDILVLELARGV